jgi:hypothetical protein
MLGLLEAPADANEAVDRDARWGRAQKRALGVVLNLLRALLKVRCGAALFALTLTALVAPAAGSST